MTKQELIHHISETSGLDPLTSQSVITCFFEVVKESLSQGEPIYIRTFGSFILKQRAPKVARNINQNTSIEVAAQVLPYFKPSPEFTNQVRTQEVPSSTKKAKP